MSIVTLPPANAVSIWGLTPDPDRSFHYKLKKCPHDHWCGTSTLSKNMRLNVTQDIATDVKTCRIKPNDTIPSWKYSGELWKETLTALAVAELKKQKKQSGDEEKIIYLPR